MNLIEKIKKSFLDFLNSNFESFKNCKNFSFELNIDGSKKGFGDLSSNACMILARELNKNPRELAQKVIDGYENEYIEKVEVAGPGFLNFFLNRDALVKISSELYKEKESFFKFLPEIEKKKISVEFVSANPTGPLHLGHGRGGIIGDVLGNVLRFVGYDVTTEYYINDAGVQMLKLGESFKARCEQVLGIDSVIPEGGYHGKYLTELAKEFVKKYGKNIIDEDIKFFTKEAQKILLERMKETLLEYGIKFDVWFSEKELHDSGAITEIIKILEKKKYLYEQDGALWFKSKEFGDDKDRVLRKKDGELTYVAADAAYLQNKVDRGFNKLIMVLGQDHHSYVFRLKGLMEALGNNPDDLYVILYQLVTLKEGGEVLRMSKRAGKIVTLKDVIELVGKDVARFFYLNRKVDAHLDFNLDLAFKKTEENPVYYIQYAYVRILSILDKASSAFKDLNEKDLENLGKEESLLIKKMISLKELLFNISQNYQTHLLTYYILDLAKIFHNYYSKNRVIDLDNPEKSRARLGLINILKDNFEICLNILGISCPKKM